MSNPIDPFMPKLTATELEYRRRMEEERLRQYMSAMQQTYHRPIQYIPSLGSFPASPTPALDKTKALSAKDPNLPTRIAERPLVGWRLWKVDPTVRPFRLNSVHKDIKWQPKIRTWGNCKCYNSGEHSCGVYACTARDALELSEVSGGYIPIVGQVWLWGRVLEFTEGFRAEFAYPKAVGGDFFEVAREIAAEYKCDLL